MSTGLKLFVFLFVNIALIFPAAAQLGDAQLRKEIVYRASLGRGDDIKILLSQGASANQTNDEGMPVLALAAARKDAEAIPVMKALLDGGADINAKDKLGRTALFAASQQSAIQNIQFLLDNNINYYAADNKGDVARTVAFREGRPDIVAIMDNFVKAQTIKVTRQYEDANRTLAQRYAEQQKQQQEIAGGERVKESERIETVLKEKQELEERLKALEQKKARPTAADAKALEEAQKLEADIRAKIELNEKMTEELRELERQEQEAAAAEKAKAEKLKQAEEKKKLAEELKKRQAEEEAAVLAEQQRAERELQEAANRLGKLSEEISYHSCAFQYWFYIRDTKLTTELNRSELDSAIEANKDKVLELTEALSILTTSSEYADTLSNRVKKRIYNRLDEIPSRRLRKEEGVGTLIDMEQRCGEIARQWQIVVNTDDAKKERAAKLGEGAGIGTVGGALGAGGGGTGGRTVVDDGAGDGSTYDAGSSGSNSFIITPDDMRRNRQPPKMYYRPGQ